MNTTYPFYFKELSDKNETIISLEDGYIKVISVGVKNEHFSQNLWRNIIEACEECECYKILGVTLTTNADTNQNLITYPRFLDQIGFNDQLKVAWIEKNPDFDISSEFSKTVFQNRSLPGRFFEKEEDAREWLMEN
ncbi:MAG: hypothetical protein RH860_01305 [Cytophagales bacterium]